MATKKKRPSRLGRGLSSLMAAPVDPVPTDSGHAAIPQIASNDTDEATPTGKPVASVSDANNKDRPEDHSGQVIAIPLDGVIPNRSQPRQVFNDIALAGLAESIKNDGMMQPVVVRAISDNEQGVGYELIAGERRWRAARIAGLKSVPAMVHDLTDEQSAQWALVENLQREDLNPIEKAEAFKRLANDYSLPHAEIASRVGLERSTVSNLLRLLALSDFCRDLVREGLLSMGQARAIAGLPDPAAQKALAQQAVRQGFSVRQVEQAARKILQSNSPDTSPAGKAQSSNSLADMEKQIGEQLGTRVKLRPGRKKGTGTLAIEFYTLDEFDSLLARMDVKTS